ncbi:phosphatidylinositol transfer protein [Aphelenchoides avenae]|nr:phosphatidylinositol transfer protein [Aphelenchus avenae]
MLIKEYRLVLPFSLDEFQRGQLYAVAECSKRETGGGEGVEVVDQRPFESSTVRPGHQLKGIYSKKIYRFKSKSPRVFRALLPDAAFVVEEESWNAYPYTRTVLTNPGYMGKDFFIVVETLHVDNDNGQQHNVLNADDKVLAQRKVVKLDIADDAILKPTDLNAENDIHRFRSQKTGRGPLNPGWEAQHRPLMCAYKLVTVHFKWRLLQNKVERGIHNTYPRLFGKFHREVFCWIDRWHHLTMAEVHKFEEETALELKRQINEGPTRGMAADNAQQKTVDES